MDPFHVSAAAMFCSATLMLTLLFGTTTSAQNTTTPSLASTSCDLAACGGLSIKYPFWLDGTHPPECGYRAFRVTCNATGNGKALLENTFWQYQILDISYEDGSFRLANLELSAGTCNVEIRVNASSDLGLAPFSISAANQELFFLYNCTDLRSPPPTWASVNCTNDGSNVSTTFSMFAWLAGGYKPDDQWRPMHGGCKVSMIPVLRYPGATGADYQRLMNGGFLLEYTAGDCTACEESGGRCRIDTAHDIFQCHCPDGVSDLIICNNKFPSLAAKDVKKDGSKVLLIALTSAAVALLIPCTYVLIWYMAGNRIWFLRRRKNRSSTERHYEAMLVSYGSLAPKRYTYSDVMKMTSSRHKRLGQGGYGVVFEGKIHDGRQVAVKFLHDCKGNGEEFVNEVMSIGRTSHVNIVSLFGFCLEGSKRALIYEYMCNSSLDRYIYSENPKEILGWERLYAIAIGIARGLEYLHHSCNTRIVHFDIKPQNILLDKDFCPKIADFGLAKLCRTKESKLSMIGARGTIGFIAPEVHSRNFGIVSTKSDVYSYGMMLLEMVGGRKNVKLVAEKSSEKYFPDWIYDHFAQDDGLEACEVTSGIEEIARKMTLIGLWCIQVLPVYRPTITKVLEMFERSLDDMAMPPKQNFSGLLENAADNMKVQSASSMTYEEITLVNSGKTQQFPPL